MFTINGGAASRLEVSFYNRNLYKPSVYLKIIKKLFNTDDSLKKVNLKCFSLVKVEEYWKTLFEGEQKHGRFIFLKELDDNRVQL